MTHGVTDHGKTSGPDPDRGAAGKQKVSAGSLLKGLFPSFLTKERPPTSTSWGDSSKIRDRILEEHGQTKNSALKKTLSTLAPQELAQFETLLKSHENLLSLFEGGPQRVRTALALSTQLESKFSIAQEQMGDLTYYLIFGYQEAVAEFVSGIEGGRERVFATTGQECPGAKILHNLTSPIPAKAVREVNNLVKGQMTKDQQHELLEYLSGDEDVNTKFCEWLNAVEAHPESMLAKDFVTGETLHPALNNYELMLRTIIPDTPGGKIAQKIVIEVSDRTFLINSQIVEDALFHYMHPEVTPDTEKRQLPYSRQYTNTEFGLKREYRTTETGIAILLTEPKSGETRTVHLNLPSEDPEILYQTLKDSTFKGATDEARAFKQSSAQAILSGIYSLDRRPETIPKTPQEAKIAIQAGTLYATDSGLSLVEGHKNSRLDAALFCSRAQLQAAHKSELVSLGIIVDDKIEVIPTTLTKERRDYQGGTLLSLTSTLEVNGQTVTYTTHYPDIEEVPAVDLERHLLLTMAHVTASS